MNRLLTVVNVFRSGNDGSAKLVLKPNQNNQLESTFETGRYFVDGEDIICLSSQIGCEMGCAFCASTKPHKHSNGTIRRFVRNLTAEEIVESGNISTREIPLNSNNKGVVLSYMGMGEPFSNIENVKESINELASHFESVRATICTIAFNPKEILKLAKEVVDGKYSIPIKLHISLHAPTDEKRIKLLPKVVSIKETLEVAEKYFQLTQFSVKLNYVLVKNVNDSVEDAHTLGKLLKGKKGLVLKISDLNAPGSLGKVSENAANEFENIVKRYNVATCRFTSHGQDIDAGCGRLVKGNY